MKGLTVLDKFTKKAHNSWTLQGTFPTKRVMMVMTQAGTQHIMNANTTTNNDLLIWISCALTSAFRLWPDSMMIKASFRDWLNILPTFLQLMLIYVAYFSSSPVPDELVKNTRYATVVSTKCSKSLVRRWDWMKYPRANFLKTKDY